MTDDRWFRYEYTAFAGGGVDVRAYEYDVVKRTAKGVWLDTGFGDRRFVRSPARKRWACPTLREAHESFLARKRRQLAILRAQVRSVERAIIAAGGSVPREFDMTEELMCETAASAPAAREPTTETSDG